MVARRAAPKEPHRAWSLATNTMSKQIQSLQRSRSVHDPSHVHAHRTTHNTRSGLSQRVPKWVPNFPVLAGLGRNPWTLARTIPYSPDPTGFLDRKRRALNPQVPGSSPGGCTKLTRENASAGVNLGARIQRFIQPKPLDAREPQRPSPRHLTSSPARQQSSTCGVSLR